VARVKRGVAAHKRHKKVLELAKGFSDFRKLWIARINAASRQAGIPYSRFIAALDKSGVELSRKQISELAIHDPAAFARLVEVVRETAPDQ
jgi:large subunit ribosomal protein L20